MNLEEYEQKCDELMKRILRRLERLSDGKASRPGMTAGAGPDSNEKGSATIAHAKGSSSPILRVGQQDWAWDIRSLRNRYGRTRGLDTKRALIAEALTLLVRARYAPKGRGIKGTKEWRERIARDPRSPAVIAVVFDISRPTVYKYRKEFHVNGHKKAA